MGVVILGEAITGISTAAQPLIHAIPSEVLPRKYRSYAQASLNVVSLHITIITHQVQKC